MKQYLSKISKKCKSGITKTKEKLVMVGSKVSQMDEGFFILRTKNSFLSSVKIVSGLFILNELLIEPALAQDISIATKMSDINREYDTASNEIMMGVEDSIFRSLWEKKINTQTVKNVTRHFTWLAQTNSSSGNKWGFENKYSPWYSASFVVGIFFTVYFLSDSSSEVKKWVRSKVCKLTDKEE